MTLEARPGIYLITQLSSGLVYVGSSVNVKNRVSRHRTELKNGTHGNAHLQRAWNKYGEADFAISVLEYLPSTDKLIACEQRHIDSRKSADRAFGFNIVPRADRRDMSAETKAKLAAAGRIAQKGKIVSAETRAKIAASLRGNKLSAATIEKRSAKRRGVPLSPEHRAAVAQSNRGMKRSAESRERMRQAQLKLHANGYHHSPESRAQQAATITKTLAMKTPEQRGVGRKQAADVIEKRRQSILASYARKRAHSELSLKDCP